MRFGVVLTGDPPLAGQIDRGRLAERAGFDDVYAWDSHIYKQESSALVTLLAAETEKAGLGLCVTNHVTRHPTVTASLFATLANMVGADRLTCGIGTGGSAIRSWGARPGTLAALEEAVSSIRALTAGESISINGTEARFDWATGGRVPVLVSASGPKSLRLAGRVADGVILTAADPTFVTWCLDQVRAGWDDAGRDGAGFRVQVAAPAYLGDDLEHARAQVAWYPAFIGSHVAKTLRSHGVADGDSDVWSYVDEGGAGQYRQRGRPGESAVQVPDEVVDRLTIVGDAAATIRKLRELESIGVTEVALYTAVQDPDGLIEGYGDRVIPAFASG